MSEFVGLHFQGIVIVFCLLFTFLLLAITSYLSTIATAYDKLQLLDRFSSASKSQSELVNSINSIAAISEMVEEIRQSQGVSAAALHALASHLVPRDIDDD
ncbi:hypothetical protein [Pseudomonas sp.]|uniref:hypothetical protein n=1 Tax=Pseudomonas sp. TaxID=306 RepID=UPI002589056E|nr:hypothetical protein [Pseudomonas sp.]